MGNTEEIFSLALGLKMPWSIKELVFDQETRQLDIHLHFEKGHRFTMPDGQAYGAHDTTERSWQHLNFFQHTCYLHAKVPRVKQSDGKIRTQLHSNSMVTSVVFIIVRLVSNPSCFNCNMMLCGELYLRIFSINKTFAKYSGDKYNINPSYKLVLGMLYAVSRNYDLYENV